MKKLVVLTLSLLSFSASIRAQEVFEWFEGSCLSRSQIDSSKATYLQVQNVHFTIIQASELSQPFLAYQPKDTAYMNVKGIRSECGNFITELEQMEYPKGEYWTNLKKAKLDNLKEQCLLHEKAVIALTQPKALRGTPYCKECSQYTDALEKGGKTLLNAWKALHDREIEGALDPNPINMAFEQRWNSPNPEFWARIELLRYGWWNCVLQHQKVWLNVNQYNQEFRKLMTSLQIDCH